MVHRTMRKSELLLTFQSMKQQEACYYDSIQSSNSEEWFAPEWRSGIVEWSYHIINVNKFSRDTVAISMNYFDRFLSTFEGKQNIQEFQLAAMTCLYIAIKVHERRAIKPKTISELSNGAFQEKQVTEMELRIATTLQWRLNPPTSMSFVRSFLLMIPDRRIEDFELWTVLDLATFQTELAVREYDFVSYAASTIALAAIFNATRMMVQERCSANLELKQVLQTMVKELSINVISRDFMICRDKLWVLLSTTRHPEATRIVQKSSKLRERGKESDYLDVSPRSSTKFEYIKNAGETPPYLHT